MKILHVISSMDPRGGGPSEGIRQLSKALPSYGVESEVVCCDQPGADWVHTSGMKVHALGKGKSSYCYSDSLSLWLKQNVQNYDRVIIKGLWQYHGLAAMNACLKRGVPYHVYTHGMLDPWFKKTYPLKHLKKWLYWPWAEYRVLKNARSVIFTCEEERRLARESFWLYRVNETVTSYGTATPPQDADGLSAIFADAFSDLAGRRFVLFLSRIHEKKGCDLLIQAFAKVAAQDPGLQLAIAGPDQTGLKAKLQALAESHGIAHRIHWLGMLSGDLKWGAFHASEAFILPSHQENFGIVVAEALGCGKPVLMSNKVNIWREIEADKAGIVANDDLAGTESLLTKWIAMSNEERRVMSENAISCFTNRFTVDAMANSLVKIIS